MDPEKVNIKTKLNELKDAIEDGNIDKIKKKIAWFHHNLMRNKQLISELDTNGRLNVSQSDLIIAACRTRNNHAEDVLYYILKGTDILDHLPSSSGWVNDRDWKRQRTEAFTVALTLNAFSVVEMLYDYWCGDLHWSGHDINKLRTLGEMLNNASRTAGVENKQLLVNIHSLTTFNTFQQTLYSSLPEPRDVTPKETAAMLLNVLNIHNEYSNLEKVRIPHSDEKQELEIKSHFDDTTSEYYKGLEYLRYEVYFRKLDFNVAMLIMENSFVVRKYLNQQFNKPIQFFTDNPGVKDSYVNAVSLYKEIENALCHYIYRTCEDQRLYLPSNRQITMEQDADLCKEPLKKKKKTVDLEITHNDKFKLFNGPVLWLERNIFKQRLNDLKSILEEHVIRNDPTEYEMQVDTNLCKEISLDDNYLTTIMSDYYSLKKIVYYIEAIENTDATNVLMIERVLKVIGEMLISTKQAIPVMESSKSLLYITLSLDSITYLHSIRNYLSQADYGELNRRINILGSTYEIFKQIKKELTIIKPTINLVLNIDKLINDKALLEKGLRLLDDRINKWPYEAKRHVEEFYQRTKTHHYDLFLESEPFLQELKEHPSLETQLHKEIYWVLNCRDDIAFKIQSAKCKIREQTINILPLILRDINETLTPIIQNQSHLNEVNAQFQELLIDDHGENINHERDDVNKFSNSLNNIKDYASCWKRINNMLSFCLEECELFGPEEEKPEIDDNIDTITNIYKKLNDKCEFTSSRVFKLGNRYLSYIRSLHDVISKRPICFNSPGGQPTKQPPIYPRRCGGTYNLIKIPIYRRHELIICLISRVNLLKNILAKFTPLDGITPSDENLRRYKNDKEFRFVLEQILIDIANALVACEINTLMLYSGELQREIDLRNILHHDDPFVEVIGDVFDSFDLSQELLSRAMMFAKDKELFKALLKFYQDFVLIQEGNFDDAQKTLNEKFGNNNNWNSYLKLIKI